MALIDSLKNSRLDRDNGKTPIKYQGGGAIRRALKDSDLGLKGTQPEKYINKVEK
tara:strand:- start:582 stop:746 length:165 start_codon:yes stop_codon:yes gene_type:complete